MDSNGLKRQMRKRQKLLSRGRAVPSLEHQWIMPSETEYPEFYVRLTPYYPRFCKPFSYYHTHVAPPREGTRLMPTLRDGQTLAQVTVRSRHGGLRGFDANHPAVVRDAYEVFNDCIDAGFTPGWFPGVTSFTEWTRRLMVGDMNMYRHYQSYGEYLSSMQSSAMSFEGTMRDRVYPFKWTNMRGDPLVGTRFGGLAGSNFRYHSPWENDAQTLRDMWEDPADDSQPTLFMSDGPWSTSNRTFYSRTGLDGMTQSLHFLRSIHSVQLITDYAPRMEGSKRYSGADQPTVDVGVNLLDSLVRPTFRDRHIILHGYDVSEDFYSPCYRQRPLPELKDYRRTLYWNPNLVLDENGRAEVTLWNNSSGESIIVSAEGITPQGKVLTGISYPEDR